MSCAKKHCPKGSENCCDDCMYKLMKECDDCCEKSKDAKRCVNYREDGAAKERREKRKKNKRTQTLILILLLIAVFLLPGLALWQTWRTDQEIEAIKKELPAATRQLRPARADQTSQSQYTESGKEARDDQRSDSEDN